MKPSYILACSVLILPSSISCGHKTETANDAIASTPFPTATALAADISQTYKNSETADIRATLLREILVAPKRGNICYVTFNGIDPDSSFIARMEEQNTPIRKISSSPEPFRRGRQSVKTPMLFTLPIRWIGRTEVEVQVDWPNAGTKYRLRKNQEKWLVTGRKMAWIS